MTEIIATPERASDSIPNTRRWARILHGPQTDKNGLPYVTHLDAVAQYYLYVFGWNEDGIKSCYLHDVVEDVKENGFSIKTVESEGYSEDVVYNVNVVSKRSGEQNYEYITRVIKGGIGPMKVKLADLYHNTEEERLATLDKAKQDRLKEKYFSAIYRIENALINLGVLKESDRTITWEQAVDAVKPTTNYTSSSTYSGTGWYKRSLVSIYKGDLIRFPKSGDPDKEWLVLEKRVKSNGAYAFSLEGWDGDIVLTNTSEYESLYQSTATYTSTVKYTPVWKKRLGVTDEWNEGDPAPKYLTGEKEPEVVTSVLPSKELVPAAKEVLFSDQ